MRKMRADKMIAATSLLTLALVAAPHVAYAEQTTAEGDAVVQAADEQAIVQDEAESEGQALPADGQLPGEADVPAAEEMREADPSESQADGTAPAAEADIQPAEGAPAVQDTTTAPSDESVAQNGVPVLTIYVDESDDALAEANADGKRSYGSLADMHSSEDHSVHCIGVAEFSVPEDFTSEYGPTTAPAGQLDLKYLRGRGNSTWRNNKRAYKIAFADKQELFGMHKSKEWALLASAYDSTLLKNRITYWLGAQAGDGWTPRLVPVDLVVVTRKNGTETGRFQYGSYFLSEFVEVAKGRLNIDEPDVDQVDSDPTSDDNITGDYLLTHYNYDQNNAEPQSTVFTVDSGVTFINHSPYFESEDLTEGQLRQREYIQNYMCELDRLIMAEGPIDAERHAAIADMMDLEAAADYWWLQEFSKNSDAFKTSSTYLFKRRNGKLVWGPLWDFDIAWQDTKPYEGFTHTRMPWFDKLREDDPLFAELLKQRWLDPADGLGVRVAELTRAGGAFDRYLDEVAASGDADRVIWYDPMRDDRSVSEAADDLKSWIEQRRAWVDAHIDEVGRVHFDVRFLVDGEVFATDVVRGNDHLSHNPAVPERDGWLFCGWREKNTGEGTEEHTIMGDTTFIANFIKESEAACPDQVFFVHPEDWADVNGGVYANYAHTYPGDLLVGKMRWTSSDESVATVDENGLVQPVGTGDVTITVTLRNGTSASYLLHVFDSCERPAEVPTGLIVPAEMTIEKGKIAQIAYSQQPYDVPLESVSYLFQSDDPWVVRVDADGVIMGMELGTATITMVLDNMYNPALLPLAATIQVTVVEAAEPQRGGLGAERGEHGTDGEAAGETNAAGDTAADTETCQGKRDAGAVVSEATTKLDAEARASVRPAVASAGRTVRPVKASAVKEGSAIATRNASMRKASPELSAPATAEGMLPKTGDHVWARSWATFLVTGLFALIGGFLMRRKA